MKSGRSEDKSGLLFVYGTLLREAAPESMTALVRRMRRVAPAIVAGYLYDLGSYPAIEIDSSADCVVRGELVAVTSAASWLRLDTYEGVNRAHPERSLFRRERCRFTRTDTGQEGDCWVYVFNRDVSHARRIPSGCWRTRLAGDADGRAVRA